MQLFLLITLIAYLLLLFFLSFPLLLSIPFVPNILKKQIKKNNDYFFGGINFFFNPANLSKHLSNIKNYRYGKQYLIIIYLIFYLLFLFLFFSPFILIFLFHKSTLVAVSAIILTAWFYLNEVLMIKNKIKAFPFDYNNLDNNNKKNVQSNTQIISNNTSNQILINDNNSRVDTQKKIVKNLWIDKLIKELNYPPDKILSDVVISKFPDKIGKIDVAVFKDNEKKSYFIIIEINTEIKKQFDLHKLLLKLDVTGAKYGIWSDGLIAKTIYNDFKGKKEVLEIPRYKETEQNTNIKEEIRNIEEYSTFDTTERFENAEQNINLSYDTIKESEEIGNADSDNPVKDLLDIFGICVKLLNYLDGKQYLDKKSFEMFIKLKINDKLMPNGILENINEYTLKKFGDTLLEEGEDPDYIYINEYIKENVLNDIREQ